MAQQRSRGSAFQQCYRCYPVSFINKPHLEKGDKTSLHIDYPMLFELRNPSTHRVTHCGVLEFIADEGLIFLPYWMMENMLLQEGDIVLLRNASLTNGTYVKLQPHTKDFLDISDPKAVLEISLRSYSCLTTGDTIMVAYNNKKYCIDIVESKPSSAISIIETDCEVDFAPPLDYKESEKPAPSSSIYKTPPEVEEEPPKKIAKFNPFMGSGRRLDGKPSTQTVALATQSVVRQHQQDDEKDISGSKPSSSTNCERAGELVFGSNVNQPQNGTPEVPSKKSSEEPHHKVKEPKFQAFTGKKYSLKS